MTVTLAVTAASGPGSLSTRDPLLPAPPHCGSLRLRLPAIFLMVILFHVNALLDCRARGVAAGGRTQVYPMSRRTDGTIFGRFHTPLRCATHLEGGVGHDGGRRHGHHLKFTGGGSIRAAGSSAAFDRGCEINEVYPGARAVVLLRNLPQALPPIAHDQCRPRGLV